MTPSIATDTFPFDFTRVDSLRERLEHWSLETHLSGGFPHREFAAIREEGLLSVTLPGEPLDANGANTPATLRLLQSIGRGNLSVGRIYEGHLNALQLIGRFAGPRQRERWFREAREGHLFGVWNTEMQDGVRIHGHPGGALRLSGSKSFCSGSAWVSRPLITGQILADPPNEGGWQMAVVDLDRCQPPVDDSFWRPLGMRNSVSHKIDFTGIDLTPDQLLGRPGDYNLQPEFSGGAIRFAAVQLGGAEALLTALRTFLRQARRTDDPHQRSRVGRMAVMVESGTLWLRRAGELRDAGASSAEMVHVANMTRTAIAGYCTECLALTSESVGARGLLEPHPFARLHDDLTMYLRQPAPDATREAIGKYYLDDTTE